MDLVDSNLKAMDAISVLEPYAKFLVEEIGGECTSIAVEHYLIEIYLASVQHVRNVLLMIQCEERGMWRLLYSPRKLSSIARQELVTILDDYTFTSWATLSDLELSSSLSEVCICDLQCYDPLEKLYYSMNYDLICIHCCSEDNIVSVQGCYPQCENCKHKESMKKRVLS